MTDQPTTETELDQLRNRLRLAHQARRAKEHQLDDIRRALCDAGLMEDNDPYSHADLADVIRQAAPAEATLTRVQALADRWDNALGIDRTYARTLRAALDEPAPAATQATEPAVSIHGARDLNPQAREALDALVNVAKQQITEDQPTKGQRPA